MPRLAAQVDKVGTVRTYGGPGEGLAAGAKTGGGATPSFTVRLAFIRTLGQALRDAHRETFGKTLGRPRIQRWPIGEKFVFAFPLPLW